ncbi:MAG TPA: DNA mismatch repair endonuclease MutL [Gemmatimonadota bacterium]|nr:DNA mismatch repair endonuclease MutL [Gemmatimonadota bacterium]
MRARVAVLPDGVVDQIAAGEVVERPSSVLKELIENALDAGAGRIEVTLEAAGRDRIRVEDDGHGMERADALLAIERHATSKIQGLADLERVRSLGFRGEALPSIASVSALTLETAPADGREGTRIRIEGGARQGVERIARARGTTVDVQRLFHNVPARREFLKSDATERAHLVRRLVEYALVRPDVAWSARHAGRSLLDAPPAASLLERVAAILDAAYAATLVPVEGEVEGVSVRGLIQRPAAAGAARRRQHVFVNGRPIDSPESLRAALAGYRSTLPPGARPDLYLFLELDPVRLDVNVHPAKREVRFRDPATIAAAVEEAVRAALGAGALAAATASGPAGPSRSKPGDPRAASRAPDQLALLYPRRPPERSEPEVHEPEAPPPGAEPAERERAAPERPVAPGLWQLHDRFILAQTASGMVVIDQHSAHERILYEEVIEDLRSGARAAQRLLFPIVLHLSPEQHATWEAYRGMIDRLGFEAEPFGGHAVAVAAIPAFRHRFDPEAALAGLLDDLAEPGRGSADMNQHERVARLFACKAAIKAGTRLASREMAELIDRLFATRLPYDDVHGRPAVLQIGLDELDRHFGRH